jgi:hypothetical protein
MSKKCHDFREFSPKFRSKLIDIRAETRNSCFEQKVRKCQKLVPERLNFECEIDPKLTQNCPEIDPKLF